GGGTGGHIYPAMAVADELSTENKVYYVGNKRNMEFEPFEQKSNNSL
ncbi:MAG: glycosyltransferase, partial [Bacteroidales bacterium]|nr:glycosyltransferase [Bacteroidales bacterium]